MVKVPGFFYFEYFGNGCPNMRLLPPLCSLSRLMVRGLETKRNRNENPQDRTMDLQLGRPRTNRPTPAPKQRESLGQEDRRLAPPTHTYPLSVLVKLQYIVFSPFFPSSSYSHFFIQSLTKVSAASKFRKRFAPRSPRVNLYRGVNLMVTLKKYNVTSGRDIVGASTEAERKSKTQKLKTSYFVLDQVRTYTQG